MYFLSLKKTKKKKKKLLFYCHAKSNEIITLSLELKSAVTDHLFRTKKYTLLYLKYLNN
jgi:hypothetical protein